LTKWLVDEMANSQNAKLKKLAKEQIDKMAG
jgi:hypothetical protein